jgi:hypothetical protein
MRRRFQWRSSKNKRDIVHLFPAYLLITSWYKRLSKGWPFFNVPKWLLHRGFISDAPSASKKAGRGDLAAAITAMPTYAKSAIVAETNMRTFGLNDDAIAAEVCALAADMKSPIVVLSAKQIAKQQAVEARKAELTAGGAFDVQSVLVQMVNNAAKRREIEGIEYAKLPSTPSYALVVL